MPRCAAGAGAARPAGSGSATAPSTCRRRPPTRRACWPGSARPPARSGSPASCGRPTTSRSCRCCRRRAGPREVRIGSIRARASSARSRCCSPTCAPSPGWPRAACPTTWCSCSTSTSRPWARRSSTQGGRVDKFIGDGIMALFGIDLEPEEACRRALAGARAMALRARRLNQQLEHDLREPLRIGIGLHVGPVILGRDGLRPRDLADRDRRPGQRRLAARGADQGGRRRSWWSRRALAERAGVDLARFELREIEIRGRRRPLRVRLVGDARAAARRGRRAAPQRRPAWLAGSDARRCSGAIVTRACWPSRFDEVASCRYLERGTPGHAASPIGLRRSLLLAALLGAPGLPAARAGAPGRSRAGARGRHLGQRRRGRGAPAARGLHRGAAPPARDRGDPERHVRPDRADLCRMGGRSLPAHHAGLDGDRGCRRAPTRSPTRSPRRRS